MLLYLHVEVFDRNLIMFSMSKCFQDMTQTTPTQELAARDLHGYEWKFKHIFRGNQIENLLCALVNSN